MRINNDTIIKDTDKLIREKSEDVTLPLSDEDKNLLLDMLKYVKDSTVEEIAEKENLRPAVGISAIQVGVKKKMMAVVIKNEEGEIEHQYALVNPRIVSHSIEKSFLRNGEGCLSVEENHQGYIYRYARVKIKAYDLIRDEDVEIRASGYLAIVFQHELDHFKGILYYDHINPNNPFEEIPNTLVVE